MPSEIFAVTVSVKLWASLLPHQWILVPTDNKRTDLLSTSKNHVFLSQACPYKLWLYAAHKDLVGSALHITGSQNIIVNCLSHWDLNTSYQQQFYDTVLLLHGSITEEHCTPELFFFSMPMMTQSFSLYQVFVTMTYRSKLLKFKHTPFQRAPTVTTIPSGHCTTSSPDFIISNPFLQKQRLSSFIMLAGFSVKSHMTSYNNISALCKIHDLSLFDSSAFNDMKVKLTLKSQEKLKRHFPLHKLPITPAML